MDMFDRKDVKADQFEKGNIVDVDSIAGRYAAKSRKTTVKVFTKSATL
jgi:molybdenum cofactor biosynthesis enzyme